MALPIAPGSTPPWPGSITTMRFAGGGDGFGAGGRTTTMAFWGRSGAAAATAPFTATIDRQLDQVGDHAMAAPRIGRQLEYAVDLERLRMSRTIRDTPGSAPEAEALDQSDRLGRIVAERPVDLRQIDRQPRRLAERDMVVVDLIAEIDHHAGDVAVTGDPNVFDARIRGDRLARRQVARAPSTATAAPIKESADWANNLAHGRRGLPGARLAEILAMHADAGVGSNLPCGYSDCRPRRIHYS